MQKLKEGEDFAARLGSLMTGGLLCLNVALGNQLQLFDRLEDASKENGIDSQQLADSLGLKERYVREWLASVATGDIIDFADEDGKYYLSKTKAEHLSMRHGDTMALTSWILPICAGAYNDIIDAFKKEGPLGVPYSRYPYFHEWRQRLTRHTFPNFVNDALLKVCPEIWSSAASEAGISVCEIGCSEGIMTSILATKFPNSKFWASDIGESEITKCNKLKAEKNLTNVTYEIQDATQLPAEWTGKFDLAVCYDVIHDLGRPDLGVQELSRVLKKSGTALLLDIGIDSHVKANVGNPASSSVYTISQFHCMPVSLNCGPDAWGLGAGWGWQRAEKLFKEFGFASVDKFKYDDGFDSTIFICKHE